MLLFSNLNSIQSDTIITNNWNVLYFPNGFILCSLISNLVSNTKSEKLTKRIVKISEILFQRILVSLIFYLILNSYMIYDFMFYMELWIWILARRMWYNSKISSKTIEILWIQSWGQKFMIHFNLNLIPPIR